jgi:hypothetical protein
MGALIVEYSQVRKCLQPPVSYLLIHFALSFRINPWDAFIPSGIIVNIEVLWSSSKKSDTFNEAVLEQVHQQSKLDHGQCKLTNPQDHRQCKLTNS